MGSSESSEIHSSCVGSKLEGSHVYINSIRKNSQFEDSIDYFDLFPEAETTIDLLNSCVARYGKSPIFGERAILSNGSYSIYSFISFEKFREMVYSFAASLIIKGVKKGDFVSIIAPNSTHWQVSHFALHLIGAICVPISENSTSAQMKFLLNHADCSTAIVHVSKLSSLQKILPETSVTNLILISSENTLSTSCHKFHDMIAEGFPLIDSLSSNINSNDITDIIYTSGSTSDPKGCLLSHKSILSGSAGISFSTSVLGQKDVMLSCMPLSHVIEICSELVIMSRGGKIGFSTGNICQDMSLLRPTILCAVPFLLNSIYDSLNSYINGLPFPLGFFIRSALSIQESFLSSRVHASLLLNNTILSPLRNLVGGRLRAIVCCGAPILPSIFGFLSVCLTPNIVNSYGLTELGGACSIQEFGNPGCTTVGVLSTALEMKFRAVEGLYYDPESELPSGEILLRGPSLFSGYHKEPQLTKNSFIDGWFSTGDIGMLTTDGQIQIIDRTKQLVKMSNGEYMSLSCLSEVYSEARNIESIYLFADPHHSQPLAVVVPTVEYINEWKNNGIEDITKSDIVIHELLDDLNDIAQKHELKQFEHIANLILDNDPFSIDNGLLTGSMKPKLSALRCKYEARLIELYNTGQTGVFC